MIYFLNKFTDKNSLFPKHCSVGIVPKEVTDNRTFPKDSNLFMTKSWWLCNLTILSGFRRFQITEKLNQADSLSLL